MLDMKQIHLVCLKILTLLKALVKKQMNNAKIYTKTKLVDAF